MRTDIPLGLEPRARPLARASALEDLGVAHARTGAVDLAIDALDRALVLYAESGATWDASRVRGRQRRHGVRRRLVARERAETGWDAMTDSELTVARRVVQGLTNREVAEQLFVSPHIGAGPFTPMNGFRWRQGRVSRSDELGQLRSGV
jgi:hypothetical protein